LRRIRISITGIRPGEKLHEVLISEDEARTAVELDDMYVVMPAMSLMSKGKAVGTRLGSGAPLPDGFRYASNTNPQWLQIDELKQIIAPIELAYEQGKLE
jgi:UDP-N-acetylglucosamine 4,6-dehydratase/5-epimerase